MFAKGPSSIVKKFDTPPFHEEYQQMPFRVLVNLEDKMEIILNSTRPIGKIKENSQ
jgi:hypothetical protein